MTTVGAIDCGTNSIRLLIKDDNQELARQTQIVRLGQSVDKTGLLAPEALQRTKLALTDYCNVMKSHGVKKLRMVATSATRDAKNKDEFFDLTAQLLGQVVPGSTAEVISGEEEAQLTFSGALADLLHDHTSLVIDLGGGSTEFARGKDLLQQGISVNMGCVRLKERFFSEDPATEQEFSQATIMIQENLNKVFHSIDTSEVTRVIGVAGTFTTLAALALGLSEYDSTAIHLQCFSFDDFSTIAKRFARSTRQQITDYSVVSAGRVDVFPVGCFIIENILDYLYRYTCAKEITISETDILDGIAASMS